MQVHGASWSPSSPVGTTKPWAWWRKFQETRRWRIFKQPRQHREPYQGAQHSSLSSYQRLRGAGWNAKVHHHEHRVVEWSLDMRGCGQRTHPWVGVLRRRLGDGQCHSSWECPHDVRSTSSSSWGWWSYRWRNDCRTKEKSRMKKRRSILRS